MRMFARRTAVALSAIALAGSTACSSTTTTATPQTLRPTTQATMTSGGGNQSTPTATPHATEFNPPGDIPDNQVYVKFSPPGSHVVLDVPEGWARSRRSGTTTFTDKLNSVSLQTLAAAKAPSVATARAIDVPALAATVSKFALSSVTATTKPAGKAVLITYQEDSAPDPVTSKVVRDAVERFEFWRHGQAAILTLSGATNADNVDPWRIISDSLHWK